MVYAYLAPRLQVVGIVRFPFTPALTGAITWADNTQEDKLLRIVGHQRVEELLRLQTNTALLQVYSEIRQELLPSFYELLQIPYRPGRDSRNFRFAPQETQPHIRILTLSPTSFDTDVERSIIPSLAMSHLRALRSLTIKGSKAESFLMECKGKGIYGDPKIAGEHVRRKSLTPETVELGYGRRLSREMVETLKCIRDMCPTLTRAFYDSAGPLEIYNNSIRPVNPYPDVLLRAHESANDGWTALDIDKAVDRDFPGRYEWREDQLRRRLTPFEGETYDESEETGEEQLQVLNKIDLTAREWCQQLELARRVDQE